MNSSKRALRAMAILAALGALAVALRLTVLRPDPVEVTVAEVTRGVVEDTVTNTRAGTVKARLRARLSPQIGGLVVELPARKGSWVERGDVVLRLEARVPQAQVRLAREDARAAAARAEDVCLGAELAARELARGRLMVADGILSAQQVDALESAAQRSQAACSAARAALEQAQAAVALALAQLELTVVRAPFSGVIAEVTTELGEWITPAPPGVPIPPVIDLLDPASLYVSAPIDEVDSRRVRVGQAVRVTVDSVPGQSFPGRVVRMAPFVLDVLEQNRTVEVEVDFDDPAQLAEVLPGTSADVEVILTRREDVLRVPTAAVGEGGTVLVLEGDVLVARTVTPGLRNWQFTECQSGVAEGELVVTMRDSAAVKAGARAVARMRR
jgi:HlyD family secretion protein